MSCYGCICQTCANNEERLDKRKDEAKLFCYTCDDCTEYIGVGMGARYRKREACQDYKISDHEVERRRRLIHIVTPTHSKENKC